MDEPASLPSSALAASSGTAGASGVPPSSAAASSPPASSAAASSPPASSALASSAAASSDLASSAPPVPAAASASLMPFLASSAAAATAATACSWTSFISAPAAASRPPMSPALAMSLASLATDLEVSSLAFSAWPADSLSWFWALAADSPNLAPEEAASSICSLKAAFSSDLAASSFAWGLSSLLALSLTSLEPASRPALAAPATRLSPLSTAPRRMSALASTWVSMPPPAFARSPDTWPTAFCASARPSRT